MKNITIKSRFGSYKVIFTNDLKFLEKESKSFLLVDQTIFNLYKRYLKFNNIIYIKANESAKSLEFAKKIYLDLLSKNFTKKDQIIAIGGGITQDLAGFVASTIFRGVKWIYAPTTLLAQTDSCIGGKTSINLKGFKNIIGTIFPPEKVIISNAFLKTLDEDKIKSGIGELTKLLILGWKGKTHEKLITIINNYDKREFSLKTYIYEALIVKKSFIEKDEIDQGVRNLLNYGHTLGHSLESVSNFKISHGIAIVYGMIFANILAKNRNLIKENISDFLNKRIFKALIPPQISVDFLNQHELLEIAKKDKKVVGNNLSFVLPKGNLEFVKVNDVTKYEFKTAFKQFTKII